MTNPNTKKGQESAITERLRTLRMRAKISQHTLAKALGISQSAYSGYETGKTALRALMLVKLADYYNINMDYIVGRTDDEVYRPGSRQM